MPIFNIQATYPNANRMMATAFVQKSSDTYWQEICGTCTSTRLVEPVPIIGAVAPMRLYQPDGSENDLNSYFLQSPQNLFQSWTNVSMFSIAYDQTGLVQEAIFGGLGHNLATCWDYALGARILKGHTLTSITGEDGKDYACTMDDVPLFSAAHTWGGVTQSNIVTGLQPATSAAWKGQDLGTKVNQFIQNHDALVERITSLVNDQGVLMYPGFKAETDLVYWVPPVMERTAKIALMQPNATVGGLNGGSNGTTTLSTEGKSCSGVRAPAFLAGSYDPFSKSGTVSPSAATAYYAFILNQPARPFYMQTFRPAGPGDFLPRGYQPEKWADKFMKEAGLNPILANVFANAIINTNINKVGENSDRDTAKRRQFFFQPVVRGGVLPGFWPTAFKIVPSGAST